MKFVKKEVIKKTNRPENNRLKHLLHKSIAGFRKQRSVDVLHASDTTKNNFCPARISLMREHEVAPKDEFISTALAVTFDYGRFLETSVVDYLKQNSIGNWICNRCNQLRVSLGRKPYHCELNIRPHKHDYDHGLKRCTSTEFRYSEPRWLDAETNLSCGTDFFVDLGEDKPILVELKSLKSNDFITITRPRKEHLLRTKLYLHLLKRNGTTEVNVDEAIVLYTCKGYGFADEYVKISDLRDAPFSPFKEFTVKREDDEEIDRIFKDALAIKQYPETKVLPRKVCANKYCTQAKECEVREQCFQ